MVEEPDLRSTTRNPGARQNNTCALQQVGALEADIE
jgi:hypothetical protein